MSLQKRWVKGNKVKNLRKAEREAQLSFNFEAAREAGKRSNSLPALPVRRTKRLLEGTYPQYPQHLNGNTERVG